VSRVSEELPEGYDGDRAGIAGAKRRLRRRSRTLDDGQAPQPTPMSAMDDRI
jgi:hypothetical protein